MSRGCLLLSACLLFGLSVPGVAADISQTQKFCPVFTDRIVGPNSRTERYRGIKIYFSSDLAARKWMRDPVSYVDTKILPQLESVRTIERPFPQQYCPVYPTRKISLIDPKVEYQGKQVYLFDQEAVKIWNSAPEKFVDAELLPQLGLVKETEETVEPMP